MQLTTRFLAHCFQTKTRLPCPWMGHGLRHFLRNFLIESSRCSPDSCPRTTRGAAERGPLSTRWPAARRHGALPPAPAAPARLLNSHPGLGLTLGLAKVFRNDGQPSEYVVPDEVAAGDIGRIGTRDGDVLGVIDSFGARYENVKPAIALDRAASLKTYLSVASMQGQFSFCRIQHYAYH